MDRFEELKKYKELLDKEIIDQEDFDAKKKELLEQALEDTGASGEQAYDPKGLSQTNAARATAAKLSAKATAVISYMGIIIWIVAYMIGDKEGAKFHLNQSLVINLAMLLCVIPVIGRIWAIFMLVVWIMGLVYAIHWEEKEVPLLGKLKLLS